MERCTLLLQEEPVRGLFWLQREQKCQLYFALRIAGIKMYFICVGLVIYVFKIENLDSFHFCPLIFALYTSRIWAMRKNGALRR